MSISLTLYLSFLARSVCSKTLAKSLCRSRARMCPKSSPSIPSMIGIQSSRRSLPKQPIPSARMSSRDTTERYSHMARLVLVRLSRSLVSRMMPIWRASCRARSKTSSSKSNPIQGSSTSYVSLTSKFTTKKSVTCSTRRARSSICVTRILASTSRTCQRSLSNHLRTCWECSRRAMSIDMLAQQTWTSTLLAPTQCSLSLLRVQRWMIRASLILRSVSSISSIWPVPRDRARQVRRVSVWRKQRKSTCLCPRYVT